MILKRQSLFPLFILVCSIIYLIEAIKLGRPITAEGIRPSFVPMVLGSLSSLFSLLLTIKASGLTKGAQTDAPPPFRRARHGRRETACLASRSDHHCHFHLHRTVFSDWLRPVIASLRLRSHDDFLRAESMAPQTRDVGRNCRLRIHRVRATLWRSSAGSLGLSHGLHHSCRQQLWYAA